MSKFNQARTEELTVNKCGYPAYGMEDKLKLVSMVLTSFFNEKKFYGDNSDELVETAKAVIEKDARFVSNLAVYARRVFNMRSVSQVLTAYLANSVNGKPFVKQTIRGITVRADDVTELMAYYINTFGKPIPNSLRKGIANVFVNFNEYELAKYKGDAKNVSMKDIICITHPVPANDEQSDMFKRCIEGRLKTPYTWETELSKRGNTKEVWEELIASGKVGYMALLRNLRNIILLKPDNLDVVLDIIADPERVKKSKQLPFRFLSAYKAVTGVGCSSKVVDALESAIRTSAENIPVWKGKTAICIDVSGSMGSKISSQSDITCGNVAAVLGLLASKFCEDVILYTFGSVLNQIYVSKYDSILRGANSRDFESEGCTRMHLPMQELLNKTKYVDRIVYLSDNMCNTRFIDERCTLNWDGRPIYGEKPVMSLVREYRQKVNPDVWVHAIDMEGYGTQQFNPKDSKVNIIAGWSDKVLDFIQLAEQGNESIVKAIEEYRW